MFEAKLKQAGLLKHVLDSIRELVTDVNFDCDEDGMKLQAMDNSHVALVALQLRSSGFSPYRCDRQMTLGINIGSFQKIVKCGANEDIITLRAHDDGDLLNIVFESLNADRVAEYEMKMMDIDIEHLGIPETIYDAEIALPSSEFSRIIRDLKEMGESVRIEATKEGVKFSANGDIGKGAVMLKHNAAEKKGVEIDSSKKKVITINDEDDDEDKEDDEDNEDEESQDKKPNVDEGEEDDEDQVKTKKVKVKKDLDEEDSEKEDENENEDEDVEMEENDEDDGPKSKKRKLANKKTSKTPNGKATKGKKSKAGEEKVEEEDLSVSIALQQSVSLTFSIKYLSNFTKATPLAKRVTLHMSNEVPLLVAYEFETGHVRYYLAPKIEDD